MSTRVTAMKTAKTASRTTTISDCARSTTRDPTRLIAAIAITISVVKTLSQPLAGVVADEERGRVAAERDRDHRAHDHDRGEVPEPRGDPHESPVAEALDQVGDQAARGGIAHAELDDGVAEQRGDDAGEQEGQPDRGAGDGARLAEQGEDAGADHRADAEECGAADAHTLPAAEPLSSLVSSGWLMLGGRHGRRRCVAAEEQVDDQDPDEGGHDPAICSGSWKEWSTTRLPSVVVPVVSASAAAICVPLAGRKRTPITAVHMAIM